MSNRSQRRRLAQLLGVPVQAIVNYHPDGHVELCLDLICDESHHS